MGIIDDVENNHRERRIARILFEDCVDIPSDNDQTFDKLSETKNINKCSPLIKVKQEN